MTERPRHDTATDDPAVAGHPAADHADATGTAAADDGAPTDTVAEGATTAPTAATASTRRPGPGPSPTSRARRSAAAAPEGLRRPSPRPAPAIAPAAASALAAAAPPAGPAPAGPAPDGPDAQPAELVSGRPSAADRARRAPPWLVAVLAVALLALAGLDGWLLTSQPASGSRAQRDQALSTAKSAVPLILSYDYRHFDSDVSAAKARLTGRAVTDYVQAMTKTIEPTASEVHAVVQAQTDGAGVEAVSSNGDQVTVVVFGEQKVTNTSLTAPRIDLFRVRVTLDRVHGQWLVSKFDQI
ncbi:MAG: Mce-associated rane protein [Pseudonocardiales bacterium]|jgi:Mce-associated membrane protein|nr:Mce-associated rane protein [Pseudonocardiales bacterium]